MANWRAAKVRRIFKRHRDRPQFEFHFPADMSERDAEKFKSLFTSRMRA